MLTKVFTSGNSQAVRIPKEFKLEQDEVEIIKRGNELIIKPVSKQNAGVIFDLLSSFEGTIKRQKVTFQERDW
jgi:antitoxin VapB